MDRYDDEGDELDAPAAASPPRYRRPWYAKSLADLVLWTLAVGVFGLLSGLIEEAVAERNIRVAAKSECVVTGTDVADTHDALTLRLKCAGGAVGRTDDVRLALAAAAGQRTFQCQRYRFDRVECDVPKTPKAPGTK